MKARARGHNILHDVRDGVSYAMQHEGIGPTIIILSTLSVMTFTIDNLLPGLADGVYHAGAEGLSWMTSIMALGATPNEHWSCAPSVTGRGMA